MKIEMTNLEVLNAVKHLAEVKRVGNVHFNYAVAKNLNRIRQEEESLRSAIDYTEEMNTYLRDRKQMVDRFLEAKKTDLTEEVAADRLNLAIETFNKQHKDVLIHRREQNTNYRGMLRDKTSIDIYKIPIIPVVVNGKSRNYIPEDITPSQLFLAGDIIDWNASISCTSVVTNGESASRVYSANMVIGELVARLPEQQREFSIRLAYNLWQLSKLWISIQMMPAYVDYVEKYEVPEMEIVERYSKKNNYGDPVRGPKNEYTVVNVDQMNLELSALQEECKEVIKAKNKLMKSDFEISAMLIPFDMLPENLNSDAMGIMFDFIESQQETE